MDKFEQIRSSIKIKALLERLGIEIDGDRGRCPIHKGNNPTAFRITKDGVGYICESCGKKGDVIGLYAELNGLSNADSSDKLIELFNLQEKEKVRQEWNKTPVAKWVYRSEDGTDRFEIHRFNQTNGDGKKCLPFFNGSYGLPDSERILYRLNELNAAVDDPIIIVEGEKCADVVHRLGFTATTNPLGSKNWKKEYGFRKFFKDRDVVIIPDADEASEKWMESIISDIRGAVSSIRILRIPQSFITCYKNYTGHDIADYAKELGDEAATIFIMDGIDNASVMPRGYEPGIITTPTDAFNSFIELHKRGDFEILDFSKWVPGLNVKGHSGDLICIMANTGVGKTRVLHNMPYFMSDANYMIVDLELSREVLGLRWACMTTGMTADQIKSEVMRGNTVKIPRMDHVFLCNAGGIDISYIDDQIKIHEDIIQKPIKVVEIDYIGLMKKMGASRYQELSAHVENFKAFLTNTRRVGIISSQVSRPATKEDGYFECPSIFDGKDSGSVENSSQTLMRMWRMCREDRTRYGLNVGKYTHGAPPPHDFELYADGLLIGDKNKILRMRKQEIQTEF